MASPVSSTSVQPFSRRHPHFTHRHLRALLSQAGVEYVFLGDALGGRPDDPASRRADGSLDMARRSRAEDFVAGVIRLLQLAEDATTAMMCAEEDPARCHRRGLVTPALLQQQAAVLHIRGDGRLQVENGTDGQLPLF